MVKWTSEYDTLTRQHLFSSPPSDTSAYPLLSEAVRPHVESFDALLDKGRLLHAALHDIGTRIHLDQPIDDGGNIDVAVV